MRRCAAVTVRWESSLSRGLAAIFSQYESNLDVETRDLHIGASGEFGYATGLQVIRRGIQSQHRVAGQVDRRRNPAVPFRREELVSHRIA